MSMGDTHAPDTSEEVQAQHIGCTSTSTVSMLVRMGYG